MSFQIRTNEDFPVGDTSSVWRVPVGDLDTGIVWADTKSAAWGTAVLAVKGGPTANGPFLEFIPQIRISPPASGTAACTPLLELRGIGYVEVSVATAESGEYLRVHVTGDKP